VVLLRGANGSGKTTLLNVLTGYLEPDAGYLELFTASGIEEFQFPRSFFKDLNPLDHFTPEQAAMKGLGRTWQELRLFSSQSLLDNLAVSHPQQKGENPFRVLLRPAQVRREERRVLQESLAVLAKLGLGERYRSSADKISLGQAKRVAIARAIQAGARTLCLDEPLAGLDSQGISGIMALLEDLARSHQITLVIAEHVLNIPRVLKLADTVWTLRDGKIAEQTAEDIALEISGDGNHAIEGPSREPTPRREHLLPGGAVLSIISGNGISSSVPVLEVEDLVVRRGNRLVIGEQADGDHVKGLSFKLGRGEFGMLCAPNGWGKTTALEALCGLVPTERGTVRLDGASIQDLPTWKRARLGLSLLQARNHTFPGLTVDESLRFAGLGLAQFPTDLEGLRNKTVAELSGGEKHKIAIACALARPALCVLMDEPFSALDPASLERLRVGFDRLLKTAAILVAVPHRSNHGATPIEMTHED
jgi:ABC-type branched-subunit amino acid transport system ATPase component